MGANDSGFFVVWNPRRGAPTFRHETRTSATAEATRLAKNNPGEQFIVLAAIAIAEVPPPVIVRELRHEMEIPF